MAAADLPVVDRLSERIHPNFPERPEVLAEKFRLFPLGCFVLHEAGAVRGYCFSHPWIRNAPPPSLDALLAQLPAQPSSYFIHDLTLDTPMQRRNLATGAVTHVMQVARAMPLSHMSLVAVNGSAPFWSRFGFRPSPDGTLQVSARAKYDAGAVHMERSLD